MKVEEEVERSKEQVATLTRRLDKSRSQNAKLVEQVKESVKTSTEHLELKAEDNEMRDAELGELRKVTQEEIPPVSTVSTADSFRSQDEGKERNQSLLHSTFRVVACIFGDVAVTPHVPPFLCPSLLL